MTTLCKGRTNQLNIPAVDGKRGADVDRVKHQARDRIKQYASNFSNFLTHMEEGLQQPGPPPVGSPAEHLVTALKGHSAYLKPLDRTFAAFADGSCDLADFLSSMKVLSMYVTSLAGIYRGCMDHQSAEATCTAALGAARTRSSNCPKSVHRLELFAIDNPTAAGLVGSTLARAPNRSPPPLHPSLFCLSGWPRWSST